MLDFKKMMADRQAAQLAKKEKSGENSDLKALIYKPNPELASQRIRIVPNNINPELFGVHVEKHQTMEGPLKGLINRALFTMRTFGEEDPIIKFKWECIKQGGDYEAFGKSLKQQGREVLFVIDRELPVDKQMIQLWEISSKTYEMIIAEAAHIGSDITSITDGFDLSLQCKIAYTNTKNPKTGKPYEYAEIISVRGDRNPSPVMADMSMWDDMANNYPDPYRLAQRYTQVEMKELLDKLIASVASSSEESDDEQTEAHPSYSAPRPSAPVAKPAPTPAPAMARVASKPAVPPLADETDDLPF